MIPKVIHYCWFGGLPLPDMAIKCIQSWVKFLPDYEIREWNESNFDIKCCDYVREAYAAKKWAFVSDYARFKILYEFGGLYFDTDVEVIKSLSDIILLGPFMGCESSTQSGIGGNKIVTKVNPGLGLASTPQMKLFREILDFYETRHFVNIDGSIDITTVVETTTNLLNSHGYKNNNRLQKVMDVSIYPSDFFCPLDYCTGNIIKTDNTRTIHWYSSSWFTQGQKAEKNIIQFSYRFGKASHIVERILTLPVRGWNKYQSLGLKKTIVFAFRKIKK